MPPDHADALRLVGELRSRLDALEAVLRGGEAARPPAPTRAWCLLPGLRVRWAGGRLDVRLRPGLYHLLAALLDLGVRPGRAVGYDALEELVEVNNARLPKTLAELNDALSGVGWPHDYHAAGAHVFAD